MDPNQPNQGQKSKPIFSGFTGSLFGNNNKDSQGQQGKKDENKGIGQTGALFSPHLGLQFTSGGENKGLSLFGNQATNPSTTPSPSIFLGQGSSALFGNTNKLFTSSTPQPQAPKQNLSPLFGPPQQKQKKQQTPQNPSTSIFGASAKNQGSLQNPLKGVFDGPSQQLFGTGSSLITGLFTNKAEKKPEQAEKTQKLKEQQTPKPESQPKKSPQSPFSIFGNNVQAPLLPNTTPAPPATQTQPQAQSQTPSTPLFGPASTGGLNIFNNNSDDKSVSSLFGSKKEEQAKKPEVHPQNKSSSPFFGIKLDTKVQKAAEPKLNLFSSISLPKKTQNPLKPNLFSFDQSKLQQKSVQGTIKQTASVKPTNVEQQAVVEGKNAEKTPKQYDKSSPLAPTSYFGGAISSHTPAPSSNQPKLNTEGKMPELSIVGRKIALSQSDEQNLVKITESPSSPAESKAQQQKSAQFEKSPQFARNTNPQSLFPPVQTNTDLSRPPLSPKGPSGFKLTSQINFDRAKQGQNTQRKRLPTFDQRAEVNQEKTPPKQPQTNDFFPPHKLEQILSTQTQNFISRNNVKIRNSFQKLLKIAPDFEQNEPIKYQPVKFIQNQESNLGANKFLNDFTYVIARIFKVPKQNYQVFGQLFLQMLKHQKQYNKYLDGILMRDFFLVNSKIYSNNMELQQESYESTEIICKFIQYYSSLVTTCLKRIQNFSRNMKTSKIYDFFLQTSIFINFRFPKTEKDAIRNSMKANDMRISSHLKKILYIVIEIQQNTQTTVDYISKDVIVKMIPITDKDSKCDASKVMQRAILRHLSLDKATKDKNLIKANQNIITQLSKTKSQIFLPFREILNRLGRRREQTRPNIKNLFAQIDGPQWVDWLSLYLGQGSITPGQTQLRLIVKALKAMKIRNIDKVLNKESQINRLINVITQESKLKSYFYQIISTLVYDQHSVQEVQRNFFNENRMLDDLRLLADEIREFPRCKFDEEDIPQHLGRSIYILTALSAFPQKAFIYENAFFDDDGFIDEESHRCDRVCHLVIDILHYFTTQGENQEIVVKCFEAIISLLQCNKARGCMALAMNANRPQMQFFNKSLKPQIKRVIQSFLTNLISTDQFYNSMRSNETNTEIQKVYTLRYNIPKYLFMTEKVTNTIPLFWFSNCLKVSIKQFYNPELLEIMLSRLKIYPNKDKVGEAPYILSAIVEACNAANFWKQFKSKLSALTYQRAGKFCTFNQFLAQQPGLEAQLIVFNSLNLLKKMLQLRAIRNKAQKLFPRHFMCKLLSSLHCLNELDRQFLKLSSEYSFGSNKSVPPIIALLSLLSQNSPYFINPSDFVNTQWVFDQNVNIDIEKLKEIQLQKAQIIDYGILRDFLTHPYNKYLECNENIASLGIYCLIQIIKEQKDASIQGLLYMCIGRKDSAGIIESFNEFKRNFIREFILALQSKQFSLSRNCWNLLVSLRTSSNNKKIAQEIFQQYKKTKTQSTKSPTNFLPILNFILTEIKDSSFNSSQDVSQIIENLFNQQWNDLAALIDQYEKCSKSIGSLNQLERLFCEKKIMNIIEGFQICNTLTEIILRQIYANHSQAQRHCYLLVQLMHKTEYLEAFNKWQTVSQLDGLTSICDQNIPRLYGQDVLELFISAPQSINAQQMRYELAVVQARNAINYFSLKIDEVINKSMEFLSIILSIDENYYANNTARLRTNNKSHLFCQLHLQPTKYKGFQFFGKSQKDAASRIRHFIQFFIQRLRSVRKFNLQADAAKIESILDLLLSWFRNCKELKKPQIATEAQGILNACFSQIGYAIFRPESVKLLLNCVKCLQNSLGNQTATDIKKFIAKALKSTNSIAEDAKQELLSLFIIVPPKQDEIQLLETIANLWFYEQNNEYFYNESRVIYTLCQLHPIQMAKLKILSKCERIGKLQDSTLMGIRYNEDEGCRTNEAKSWLWILKIASVLLQYGMNSTLVVHEISRFVQTNKKRLIYTFNQCRQGINLKKQMKQIKVRLTLAQLDQLEASLELFVVLSQCKMWIEMNRQLFEELLYYLMHKTIVLFAPISMRQKLKKWYVWRSACQQAMVALKLTGNTTNDDLSIAQGFDADNMDEQNPQFQRTGPNIFRLSMSLRFNQCSKLWLMACSNGMRNSCFVREYFGRGITTDARGNSLMYSLTHWEHLDKAIIEIIQKLSQRLRQWGEWRNKNELLGLMNDSFSCPEFFTETGYIYSLIKLPETQDQLITELGETLALALEMGACHLTSKLYFRNKNGTISKQNMQGFQERLRKQSRLAEQKLVNNKINREDPVFQQIKMSMLLLAKFQVK